MSNLDERQAKAEQAKQKRGFVQSMVEESKPEKEEPEKLTLRSYYLTDDLIEAVAVKAAKSKLDKSSVVRNALKSYLSEYLE